MRVRSSPLALLALPHIAAAVTLADFLPRVENLPDACQAIYTSTVSSCQGSDFTSHAGCSTACINGLQEMTAPVQAACGNQNLEGSNVIVAYLAGSGPETVCSNAGAVLAAESSSSAAAALSSSSTTTQETTTSSTSSSETDTTTSTTSPSTTSSSLSSSTAEQNTIINTASSTSALGSSSTAVISSTTSASSTTTATKPSQSSSSDGTVGSDPFNTQNNSGSEVTTTLGVSMLTIGMLILALR